MNYIKHLTAFLEKVQKDERLTPSHISLYLALFHYWNLNMFNNPICVSRAQLLELCKIGSQHTYYKCLKELHLYGYIQYIPSHNPSNGCKVYLCIFDVTSEVSCANMHNLSCKNDITIAAKMQPSINNINHEWAIKTH